MRGKAFYVLVVIAACSSARAQSDDPITTRTAQIQVQIPASGLFGQCAFLAKSVSYGLTSTSTSSAGAGGGKADFGPLTVVKPYDQCSASFVYTAATAVLLPEILVSVNPPPGAMAGSRFVIRLGAAGIKSIADSASDGKVIQEMISFSYQDITTAEVDAAGRLLSCTGWNIAANTRDTSHCSELGK